MVRMKDVSDPVAGAACWACAGSDGRARRVERGSSGMGDERGRGVVGCLCGLPRKQYADEIFTF
jgi:hypothetical protein